MEWLDLKFINTRNTCVKLLFKNTHVCGFDTYIIMCESNI